MAMQNNINKNNWLWFFRENVMTGNQGGPGFPFQNGRA
jgi:hypothetical protein